MFAGHRVIPCANTREQASCPSWLDFATGLFCGGYWSGRAMGHEADIDCCQLGCDLLGVPQRDRRKPGSTRIQARSLADDVHSFPSQASVGAASVPCVRGPVKRAVYSRARAASVENTGAHSRGRRSAGRVGFLCKPVV